jgi:hypothetical protein
MAQTVPVPNRETRRNLLKFSQTTAQCTRKNWTRVPVQRKWKYPDKNKNQRPPFAVLVAHSAYKSI